MLDRGDSSMVPSCKEYLWNVTRREVFSRSRFESWTIAGAIKTEFENNIARRSTFKPMPPPVSTKFHLPSQETWIRTSHTPSAHSRIFDMTESIWASKRLFYRAVEDEDADLLRLMVTDGNMVISSGPGLPAAMDKKGMLARMDRLRSNMLGMVICLPSESDTGQRKTDPGSTLPKPHRSHTPIGTVGLRGPGAPMDHHRYAELFVNVIPEYQSKGYGSEALLWAMRWGFEYANLYRIAIVTSEWNEGAFRLYQRLGFKLEGREREIYFSKGRRWDRLVLGMLEREWKELYGSDKST